MNRSFILLASIVTCFYSFHERAYAATASVDHMRITVYYTDAVVVAAPFFSWWSLPLMLLGCGWVLWKEGYLGGDIVHE